MSAPTAATPDGISSATTGHSIATPDTDDKTTYANMGTYCTKFNEMSGTYTDWYIRALGQLHETWTNRAKINAVMTNIGGRTLDSNYYWSSSEVNYINAWWKAFDAGSEIYYTTKNTYNVVRFVRDID